MYLFTMTENGDKDAVGVGVIFEGAVLQHPVNLLEGKVIEDPDLEVQGLQSGLQVVSVRVGPVPLLQAQPGVKVHVVENEGNPCKNKD